MIPYNLCLFSRSENEDMATKAWPHRRRQGCMVPSMVGVHQGKTGAATTASTKVLTDEMLIYHLSGSSPLSVTLVI